MAKKEKKKKTESQKMGYSDYLEKSKIHVPAAVWILLGALLGIGIGFALFILFPVSPNVALMAVIIVPILMIGFPYIMKERRDTGIEEAIPDVFEELATSLRAGATIEQALIDLTKIQKGDLIDELKIALNDMEGGFSFEEALDNLAGRISVIPLKRIFKIIIDGRKAGGELADILDAVASDERQMARIQRERRSKTVLYVVFIFMAGAIVAPLIFGFVTEIGSVVVKSTGAALAEHPFSMPGMDINIFWVYLVIESVISGLMLSFVRGVRVWRGLIFYSLTMILIGTIVFEVSIMIARSMLPV